MKKATQHKIQVGEWAKKLMLVSGTYLKNTWKKGMLQKIWLCFCAFVILLTTSMYGIAYWYQQKHKNEPITFGSTFIPTYAESFGLDPQETMQAMIDDLGIKRFRLVSYWRTIEKEPGAYDFSQLDWQFEKVKKAGGRVSLAIGLRQPRWPECHAPEWAKQQDIDEWYPRLRVFLTKVVERYKDSSVLESYQLENEFFMSVFGDCPDHSAWRLKEEYELVKSLDTDTPVIVTRSNNWIGIPVGEPRADIVGVSVYKRIWDKTATKRYFEYPIPPWYYSFLAGTTEIATDRNTFIHELQAESWLPEGYAMNSASNEEVYKSMNPKLLKERLQYAVDTGMKTIDLWGPEWWYFMKQKRGAPELWNTAKIELTRYR